MSESIQTRLIEFAINENWGDILCPVFHQNMYYIPYPNMIRKCYGLSMNERGVLLDILSHLGENEEAFPSQETIACNLGISESTVKSAITALEKKMFIKTIRRRGRVNRYRIDLLESNPYFALSETIHFFLRLYQPKYFKKTVIQSVITSIVNGTSYAKYAQRIYEAYHLPNPAASDSLIVHDILMELIEEIRLSLLDKKNMEVSLPIYLNFQKYLDLYHQSIGFDDGAKCNREDILDSEEEDPSHRQ